MRDQLERFSWDNQSANACCSLKFLEWVNAGAYLSIYPLPSRGRVFMVTVMVAADLGIGVVAASETNKQARRVTWPPSPSTEGHVTLIAYGTQEGYRTNAWTVAGRYGIE